MKSKIVSLVLCSLLAVSLFACGEKRGAANDNDVMGDEHNYTNNGSSNSATNQKPDVNQKPDSSEHQDSTDTDVSTGDNAKRSDVMGNSAISGNTFNPANGTVNHTATWKQMLENGRVHDRDGFLLDGENSHWA